MKKFETPELEVINFSVEDVITTSVENETLGDDDPNALPWG